MSKSLVVLVLSGFMAGGAWAGNVDAPPSLVMRDAYRVGPGDVLQVDVLGEADLTGPYVVLDSGVLDLPFVEVPVTGLTVDEARNELVAQLSQGWLVSPQITVSVAQHRSHKVVVYGGVKQPGTYFLTGPTTLVELLTQAGWLDPQKSSRALDLRRADGSVVKVSVDELEQGLGNMYLAAGDQITVKEGQLVYVAGEVSKPGAVSFSDGLTVMQALTHAGGPSQTARLRGAYVLRGDDRIPVNLRRIQEGREADVEMRPGDQLYVRESVF